MLIFNPIASFDDIIVYTVTTNAHVVILKKGGLRSTKVIKV